MGSNQETSTHSRRTILKVGSAVAMGGLLSPGAVIAQTDLPLEIKQFPESEYIVIRNVGDEEVDITGYKINFDAEGGNNQIRQLAGEVVIGPGEEIVVPTGAEEVDQPNLVQFTKPYTGSILANDGSDVVALLTPDDEVVVTTDGTGLGDGDDDGDDGDDDGTDGDETHTLTVTVTDEGGDPLSNADVDAVTYDGGAEAGSATTDEDGVVELELEDGSYEITVSHEDYVGYERELVDIDGTDKELPVTVSLPLADDADDDGDDRMDEDRDKEEDDAAAVDDDRDEKEEKDEKNGEDDCPKR